MKFVTSDDISRMKSSVTKNSNQVLSNDEAATRLQMKQKSAQRVSGWTDTLESKRKSKLRWKEEIKDREEQKRQEVDRREEELRNKMNSETISRAKALQYEQVGRVRLLRSQQLYTDVIETRQGQMKEKEKQDGLQKIETEKWHVQAMANLKHADAKAESEKRLTKEKRMENARMMGEQKLEADERRRLLFENKRKEEELILEQARMEVAAAEESCLKKKELARTKARDEMEKLALDSKLRLAEEQRVELKEQRKREDDIAKFTSIAKARANLELKHFEERQARRQILSDRASQDLEKRAAREVEIFIKDQKEILAKEEARKKNEARKAKEIEEGLTYTRREQMVERQRQIIKERELDAIFARQYAQQCQLEIEREKRKEVAKRQKSLELRKLQETQMKEDQRKRKLASEAKLLEAKRVQENLAKEDDIFREFALKEMKRFEAQGKKIDLLQKVVST